MFSVESAARALRRVLRSSVFRLTLLLSAVFSLGLASVVLLALFFGREALLREVDASLAALAVDVAAGAPLPANAAVLVRPVDEWGALPGPVARAAERGGGSVETPEPFRGSEEWRVAVATDADGKRVLLAAPMDDRDEALEVLGGVLMRTAAVVLLVSLAVGLIAGRRAQRRLGRINDALASLARGDLQARTGVAGSSDDLDDLAHRLDATAAALERLMAQTRTLSASLAHDLRTPLARLIARLEQSPDGPERAAALAEAATLSETFDAIMRIARIEAAHGDDGVQPVDLGALAEDLAETFEPVLEAAGKTLVVDGARAGVVQADRQMVVQAVANLIQNALAHGGPTVTLFADGPGIGVADNGPGLDPARYDDVVKPHVLLDPSGGRGGAGLGLALARAVADRHGGRLILSENVPHGLRVELRLTKM